MFFYLNNKQLYYFKRLSLFSGLFEIRAQDYLDSLPGGEHRGVNKFLKGLGNENDIIVHLLFVEYVCFLDMWDSLMTEAVSEFAPFTISGVHHFVVLSEF